METLANTLEGRKELVLYCTQHFIYGYITDNGYITVKLLLLSL